jgi:hypothetical protein
MPGTALGERLNRYKRLVYRREPELGQNLFAYAPILQELKRELKSFKGKKIVELGPGEGGKPFLSLMEKMGAEVYGIEQPLPWKSSSEPVSEGSKGRVFFEGAENLLKRFRKNEVDAVVSANFLVPTPVFSSLEVSKHATPGEAQRLAVSSKKSREKLLEILKKAHEITKDGGVQVHLTSPWEAMLDRQDFERAGFEVVRKPGVAESPSEEGKDKHFNVQVFVLKKKSDVRLH